MVFVELPQKDNNSTFSLSGVANLSVGCTHACATTIPVTSIKISVKVGKRFWRCQPVNPDLDTFL